LKTTYVGNKIIILIIQNFQYGYRLVNAIDLVGSMLADTRGQSINYFMSRKWTRYLKNYAFLPHC